jgi:hypothetical protein
VFFNEEIKLAGSIDMVFQDKYRKSSISTTGRGLRRFLTTARSTSSLKQSISHLPDTGFGIIASIEHLWILEVWDEDC